MDSMCVYETHDLGSIPSRGCSYVNWHAYIDKPGRPFVYLEPRVRFPVRAPHPYGVKETYARAKRMIWVRFPVGTVRMM